jgi:hypothetical protein
LEQVWGGDFSGFATESIAVDFFDQKRFVAFGAVLLAKDVQPASQRWLDLVKATTKMHGAPSRFAPPPEQVDAGTAAYDALDKRIAGGEWEPLALWNFKGGAAILIKVEVGMLDNNGNRSLKPVWLAMTTP